MRDKRKRGRFGRVGGNQDSIRTAGGEPKSHRKNYKEGEKRQGVQFYSRHPASSIMASSFHTGDDAILAA
eukprot:scaffold321368_cov15-Tisochrysis_lutea.AAC.1